MATLTEQTLMIKNQHLLDRISAALAVAAEAVRNEQQDFAALAADDTFTATAHGYADGDKVELANGSIPTGVVAATLYYIRDKTNDTFKLAPTAAGAAIDLTADGYGQVAVEHHPERFIWASDVLLIIAGARTEAKRAIWLVLQNATVADGYAADRSGAGVTDNDIQFVVNGLVNILAGVES